jgi:hypothetical protein
VLLLLAISASLSLPMLARAIGGEVSPNFNHEFAELESRLEVLRPHLPARGAVGYIDLDGVEPKSVISARTFVAARYLLAPVIVERGVARDLVIGNFASTADRDAVNEAIERHGLTISRDLGDNLLLLKKAPRR